MVYCVKVLCWAGFFPLVQHTKNKVKQKMVVKVEVLNEVFCEVSNISDVLREDAKLENPHPIYDLLKTVQVLLRKEMKVEKHE